MRSTLGVVLVLLAGSAGAQMYKCTGADGKTSFSDRPCAAAGARQQVQAATLSENARRIGISESFLAEIQQDCARGVAAACLGIDDVRAGPAPDVNDAELARRWQATTVQMATMRKECQERNSFMCLRMERAKRSTAALNEKEEQATLTKLCAAGKEAACCELDPGPCRKREVAEDRAEQRRRALEREGARCQQGDRDACARVEQLRRNP